MKTWNFVRALSEHVRVDIFNQKTSLIFEFLSDVPRESFRLVFSKKPQEYFGEKERKRQGCKICILRVLRNILRKKLKEIDTLLGLRAEHHRQVTGVSKLHSTFYVSQGTFSALNFPKNFQFFKKIRTLSEVFRQDCLSCSLLV